MRELDPLQLNLTLGEATGKVQVQVFSASS